MPARAQEFLKRNVGILVVLLIALLVRLLYLWTYFHLPDWTQLTVDNWYHYNWAMNIVHGNVLGDTTYFRAPFYIYCLAALYKLFGAGLWVPRLFGLVIGLISILLTYAIGSRVFDRKVGLLAALLQALFPIFIYFESELLLDPLFMLLLEASVLTLLIWWDSGRIFHLFLAGLLLGLSAITRPTSLVLLPVLLIVIIALRKNGRLLLRHLAAFVLGLVLTIGPIFVRNLAVAHDPVLISSQGGINLYIGNNSSSTGLTAVLPEPLGYNWRINQITYVAEQAKGRKLKPGEVSSYWTGQAVNWILTHPGKFLSLYLRKLYHNVENLEVSNNRSLGLFFAKVPLLGYNPLSFGIIFALAVGSLACGAARSRRASLLIVLILTYTFVTAFFFFTSRFRLPLIPFYLILASYAAVIMTRFILSGRFRELIPVAIVSILAGLFSFAELVKTPYSVPVHQFNFEGLVAMNSGNISEAMKEFKLGRAADSTYPEINLNLGAAFLKQGLVDSAIYYFRQEQLLNPGRLKATTNIASIDLVRNELDSALTEIRPVIQKQPYDVTANMVYLRALLRDTALGNINLLDSVQAASIRTDSNIYLLNDAAGLLLQRNRREAAERIYQEAARSHPPPIETDDEAFEPDFKNSIPNWNHQRALSYYQLGFMGGVNGDFASAVTYSERAITLDSNLAEAYVNLVSGYYSQGKMTQARDLLAIALKRFPDNSYLLRLKQTLGQ